MSRGLRIGFCILSTISTVALFTAAPYLALAAESDKAIVQKFWRKAEECRGGSGDKVETWVACTEKEQAAIAMVVRGYCLSDAGWQEGKPANDYGECRPGAAETTSKLVGQDYATVRRQLIAEGWVPDKTPDCAPSFICADFPEAESCNTSGAVMYCLFNWSREVRRLQVLTAAEEKFTVLEIRK
jgi:hypothetical protein